MAKTNVPRVGAPTPLAKPLTAVSSLLFAANSARSKLFIQNPSVIGGVANAVSIWVDVIGTGAVAAPPSIEVPPGAILDPDEFVWGTAINARVDSGPGFSVTAYEG